jgi:hypothetical protein
MQHASMFALTSRFEAFGQVMAEAMSAGLPVLSTRSGGPDSILPGYAGILVDCESVPAVFVGLKNMYTRYTEFQQEKIRKFAIRRFGKTVIMKCYKLVLDTVLARASAPPPKPEIKDHKEHVPEEIKREVSLKSKVKTVSKSTGQGAFESERPSKETVLAGD